MRRFPVVVCVSAVLCALLAGQPATAQFGKLKKKAEEKVTKKADQKADEEMDKAIDKATGEGGEAAGENAGEAAPGAAVESATTESAAGGGDWGLYKKYDFIPGNKVIFFDDLSREELGEFPSRWNLDAGVFEVGQLGPEKWIVCTDDGKVMPKVESGALPDKYTVEVDFYDHGAEAPGHWLHMVWVNAAGEEIGFFRFADHTGTTLRLGGKDVASKTLPAAVGRGAHTMRIMATRSTIKCYIDNERVANVPMVEGFQPVGFRLWADLWQQDLDKYPLMFRNFRFAEGGKTMKEQLAEAGRIVTHGILFSSGSADIRPESYKTLADISTLLSEDAALRLSIEGHTDADGEDGTNLKLSEARAGAVRTYLAGNGVAGDRLEVKGLGETKPIDSNETPEGKANNRRVELVRI